MGYARSDDGTAYVVDGHGPLHLQWVSNARMTSGLEATLPPRIRMRFEIELTEDLSPALALRTVEGCDDPDVAEEVAAAVNATALATGETHFAFALHGRALADRDAMRARLEGLARATASARTEAGRARGAYRTALHAGREARLARLAEAVGAWLHSGGTAPLAETWAAAGGGPLRVAVPAKAGLSAGTRGAADAALDRLLDDPGAPAAAFGPGDVGLANDLVERAVARHAARGGVVHAFTVDAVPDRWATRIGGADGGAVPRPLGIAAVGWMANEGRIGRGDLLLVEARAPIEAHVDAVSALLLANRVDAPVIVFSRSGVVMGRPQALEARVAAAMEAGRDPEPAGPTPR